MTRRLVALAAALAVVVAVDLVAARSTTFFDLTAEDSLSLTDETKRVLDAVDRDVDVTAFLSPDERGFAEATVLLSRYRRLNRRVSYEVLDPLSAPGEARRLGVDPTTGAVAVAMGEQVEVVPTASEQDITSALARLVRGEAPVVCFAIGHGELRLGSSGSDGLNGFGEALARNGYSVRVFDLLPAAAVAPDCGALVIAQPTAELGPAGEVVATWLAEGGRALVLSDPSSSVDLGPVLEPWGLGIRRGIVFEGDPAARFPDDETSPIVTRYSSANPVVRNLAPTYFPGVQEVTVDESLDLDGLTVNRLADTTPLSYLETEPVEAVFEPTEDRPGPITVMAAADRSQVRGEDIVRTRLVVVGDADVATNAFLGEGANTTLLVQAMDWLTLDENLVSVSANLPADRPLRLTDARLRYARSLAVGVVPALFLLVGALVWAVRRSR